PIRKVDPGEKFPWAELHRAGIGHWVEPATITGGRFFQRGDTGQPVEALQSMLSLFGYGTEITGEFSEKTASDVKA
ncbi:N-acetylmuramoyl-L-alanine amidase, partial [Rhizobium ruizarguesonis]